MTKFYVTTPIYYINDVPHIGHAYATIAADVLARYWRAQGAKVLFLTGTDENSQKTVDAAKAQKQDLKTYTDQMAERWQKTWDELNISYDRFIRTTEPAHREAVENIFQAINTRGDIYKGIYKGLYCVGHEAFLKSEELVDGKCPDHGTSPQQVEEENYFFKLSSYQAALLKHIKDHPEFIAPATRRNEVVAFIKQGLEDVSISRAKQQWGIPLPIDTKQVVYVWFDALINYLSGAGYPEASYSNWWPADSHIIGKDIIKFHCVIWPAMLMSAGIELPHTIFAHGFFKVDGTKISKSLGNAIDPLALVKRYGVDSLRYYLLREIPFGKDGEFSNQRLGKVYASDLANELGNLVSRVAAMIKQYQRGVTGQAVQSSHDIEPYHQAMANFRLDKALDEIWLLIKGLNQYIDEQKPWVLAKADDREHLDEVLSYLVSNILQVAKLLEPFLPETAAKIATTFDRGVVKPDVEQLFPKIDN